MPAAEVVAVGVDNFEAHGWVWRGLGRRVGGRLLVGIVSGLTKDMACYVDLRSWREQCKTSWHLSNVVRCRSPVGFVGLRQSVVCYSDMKS